MNVALLLAGGVGVRLESDIPKPFIRINEKMLITYALETLIVSSYVDEIQVVAEHEWREFIMADCENQGISTEKIKGFAMPGFNRQISILNGLQNILREKNELANTAHIEDWDTILIHDAVRPLLTEQQISNCFKKLQQGYDGVISSFSKAAAYRRRDDNKSLEMIDCKEAFSRQTPELFYIKKYYQANMYLMPDRLYKMKDSAEPAILAGMDIAMILEDENNFKITTQIDLDRFCQIVQEKDCF